MARYEITGNSGALRPWETEEFDTIEELIERLKDFDEKPLLWVRPYTLTIWFKKDHQHVFKCSACGEEIRQH